MITLTGQLAVRTVHGRNGPFNVARLTTTIGEFSVKDALLDQLEEGKYEGDFVISQIKPSSYFFSNRTVIEVRAILEDMTLNEKDDLSQDEGSEIEAAKAPDPIEEESASPQTEKIAKLANKDKDTGPENSDADLFGILWPLGDSVKLDVTVDRQTLRAQKARLEELGYELDFKTQTWSLLTSF